jgi:hypothetical protein
MKNMNELKTNQLNPKPVKCKFPGQTMQQHEFWVAYSSKWHKMSFPYSDNLFFFSNSEGGGGRRRITLDKDHGSYWIILGQMQTTQLRSTNPVWVVWC